MPEVTFTPTISGLAAGPGDGGRLPRYRVRSGQSLAIRVTVTVPGHVTLTALWFGISTGTWGTGRQGRPVGMDPVLARFRRPLTAGRHTFGLRWQVPRRHPASLLYLTYAWSSSRPPADVTGPIATLLLR